MTAFRSAQPSDRRFVVSAWSASLRKSAHAGMICDDDWPDVMRPQIERVLDQPGMRTIVAYSPNAEPGIADLFGFITFDAAPLVPVVAYVYVKQAYRRSGLATRLFAAADIDPRLPFDFICSTVFCEELSSKIPNATFKPVLGRKRAA